MSGAFTALCFSGCQRAEVASAQTLRISQRNEPADLDPARATLPDEFFIIRALGEGLLVPAPDGGEPQPAIAERYDVSTDGLRYTFHLRGAAQWSNGEPVTAMDFVESYRRLLAPVSAAPKADLFFAVKNARDFVRGAITDFSAVGFDAPDPRTLIVTLAHASPRFPHFVASGPWIPVHSRTVTQHEHAWTKPENFVGNGPFTLAEWRSQQRIVVKRNPRYRAATAVRLDEIHFVRFDHEASEENAFRAGQIDVTLTVPKSKLAAYARERPEMLHHAANAETRSLSFNTARAPFTDPRVRRALALAIDRPKLVERVLLGGQEPAGRFLPPALRGERQPYVEPWAQRFSPDEARRLLADAGFAGGKNFPRLELTGWSNTPVLEAVQAMWRQELGIVVAIAIREAKIHLAALREGDYDVAFITSIPDVADPADMLGNFVTGSPDNYPHWRSADYDRLLSSAAIAADRGSQSERLLAAERELITSAAVAPLYFNARNWLMSSRVRGWQEDAFWTRFYQNVHLDEK